MMKCCFLDPGTLVESTSRSAAIGRNPRDTFASQLAVAERQYLDSRLRNDDSYEAAARALSCIATWGKGTPYSYGLLQMAGLAIQNGVDATYVNLELLARANPNGDLRWGELLDACLPTSEAVFCLTAMTPSYGFVVNIASIIRAIRPTCPILLGGPHASFAELEDEHRRLFDVVVSGEGEGFLLDYFLNDDVWRSGCCCTPAMVSARRYPPFPMERLAMPEYQLLRSAGMRKQQYGTLMTSRGCKYRCRYCVETSMFPGPVRYRPVGLVVDEMMLQHEMFGTKHFYFLDSSLDQDRDYLLELCGALRRSSIRMTFAGNVQPRNISTELANAMAAAGFISLFIGLENFADQVLEQMGRPRFSVSLRAIEGLFRSNVPVIGGTVMFGFPGDSMDNAELTIRRAEMLVHRALENRTVLHMNPAVFVPYPGTPPYENPERYRLRLLSRNYRSYNRYEPVHELDQMSPAEMSSAYEKFARTVLKAYQDFAETEAR